MAYPAEGNGPSIGVQALALTLHCTNVREGQIYFPQAGSGNGPLLAGTRLPDGLYDSTAK